MHSNVEIRTAIERLRRATRNVDVLDVCDELERRLNTPATLTKSNAAMSVSNKSNARFDKKAYQRDYMRKRRSEARA